VVSIKTKKAKISPKEMKRDPMWELYEKTAGKIEPHRPKLIKGIAVIAGAIALAAIVYMIMGFQTGRGQQAFARALEIHNAQVVLPGSDTEKNKSSTKKTYTDEQQKYKDAAAAFDSVASSYSSFREISRYYAAVNRVHFDPAKAQNELEQLSKDSSDVGFWSKTALAELYAATNQPDKAIEVYQKLKENSGPLPKSLVLYNLGRLYERQGKTQEAVQAYVETATANRSSDEGKKAQERLNALDPEAAKKLPPEKKDDES
jgi:tetratricopeptide (TPR) repeat protein